MAQVTKRSVRVLVVDDEVSVREFVDRVLREAGYETAVAVDGPEAIMMAKTQGPFDLLLADVIMPEMRGVEVARRLREIEPDLRVLYLTGHSDEIFKERGTLWGNDVFLNKPTTATGLLQAVSLVLSGLSGTP